MAYYDIYDGIISSGLILSIDDSMYISSNGTANSTTINSGGSMYIESGGTANGTIVNSGGDMYIESGGTARKTIINSDAAISIHNNASASDITIHSAGILLLYEGNADLITIASGGNLYVSNGCSATNISWTPCEGSLTVNNGAHVTFADNISGVYFGSNNKLLSHTQSMSKKRIFDTTMYVMTGGIADSTSLQRGDMYIMSGGTAVNTDLNGCGKMIICSGGTADNILLNTGDVYVHSGGTATNVIWTPCQGHISVACGANVTFASSYSGVYFGSNLLLQS